MGRELPELLGGESRESQAPHRRWQGVVSMKGGQEVGAGVVKAEIEMDRPRATREPLLTAT
jgi:hypothetical protein